MNTFKTLLARRLSSERFDGTLTLVLFCIGAIGVMVMGFRKLAALTMSEEGYFFGVLLVLTVSLLMVLCGLVVHLTTLCEARRDHQTSK